MSDVFEEAADWLDYHCDNDGKLSVLAARLRTEGAAMRRVCEAAERTMRHLSRGGSIDSIDPEDARIIRETWKEDGR